MENGPNMMEMIEISILTPIDVEDNNHQMGVMKKRMRLDRVWDIEDRRR